MCYTHSGDREYETSSIGGVADVEPVEKTNGVGIKK
jgi:hypothetical protein